MALSKKIKQSNGIETAYHRILFLQVAPNQGCSICVQSYMDELSRNEETSGENEAVYKTSITYEFPYDENMTIKKAYSMLKKIDMFSNATDI